MAAISKIYGTTEQYDEFWAWCKVHLRSALPYFFSRAGYQSETRPIANFPMRIDRAIMKQALDSPPPLWVLERLGEQYVGGFPEKVRGRVGLVFLADEQRVVRALLNVRHHGVRGRILDRPSGHLSGREIERSVGQGYWRLCSGDT